MWHANVLREYGLFDAMVPRYTSYPPANRFEHGVGARFQTEWMSTVNSERPVSLYVHIPFCRRLCWFCACRTQGTQTRAPVEQYIKVLRHEISVVARDLLPKGISMARLHLGGGTPTLLSPALLTDLLDCISTGFPPTDDFEFSVEIDPTEAPAEVLEVLAQRDLARASVGVQDFAPRVQKAIGRMQSFEVTRDVVIKLRRSGLQSLNVDVLYGLPYQSRESLLETLSQVVSLGPDRIALYGYAHVPHMSKRQVMIPSDALPSAERRFELSQAARDQLIKDGYHALGIDHFAMPYDSLKIAADQGRMSRNFQGYTDEPCETLIGFGVSAISKFPQGYLQNAVSTSAYTQRVRATGLAAHKGILLSHDQCFKAAMINDVMCQGILDAKKLSRAFPDRESELSAILDNLMIYFPDLLVRHGSVVSIREGLFAAARLIAAHLDQARQDGDKYSMAI
ncbi:MAG: oxygen-independent coproporphyrinogen III oxidase [Pseudomonadota bacterium]